MPAQALKAKEEALVLMLIVGILALGVGLLVAMPVVMLASVHAYRVLSAGTRASSFAFNASAGIVRANRLEPGRRHP